MDCVNPEIGFDYYFNSISVEQRGESLPDAVRRLLSESVAAFQAAYPQRLTVDLDELLQNHCHFPELKQWEDAIRPRLTTWLQDGLCDTLVRSARHCNWDTTLLVDDFVEVLQSFFGESTARCFTVDGNIRSALLYHWGGIRFEDFFFDHAGQYYHLHFDFCD